MIDTHLKLEKVKMMPKRRSSGETIINGEKLSTTFHFHAEHVLLVYRYVKNSIKINAFSSKRAQSYCAAVVHSSSPMIDRQSGKSISFVVQGHRGVQQKPKQFPTMAADILGTTYIEVMTRVAGWMLQC